MTFVYRHALPIDTPGLLELYAAAFGKQFSPEWWQWYQVGPAGRQFTAVATCDNRLAAAYSLLPMWLNLGGDTFAASLCNNVCTHPDFQGQGLFVALSNYALAEEARRGTRISLGMPNSKAFPGHMKAGWRVVTDLPLLVKANPQRRLHQCHSIERFEPQINGLLSRVQPSGLSIARDHYWLNWRFVERPERYYRIFVFEAHGETQGYIVVKHYDAGDVKKAHICDCAATNHMVLGDLVAAAEDYSASRDRLDLWTNSRAPFRATFLDLGFEEEASQDKLIIHTNYGTPKRLDDEPIWVAYGDNDVH